MDYQNITKKINATPNQFNKKFDYFYGKAHTDIYDRNKEPKDFEKYADWGDYHSYTDDKLTGKYVIALIRYRMDGLDTSTEHYAFAKTWEYFVENPVKAVAKKPTVKKKPVTKGTVSVSKKKIAKRPKSSQGRK